MLTAAKLAKNYRRNATIIEWQTDGLSHADSLIQTPYRINCLNWVLGHIGEGRDGVLEMAGADRVAEPGELDRYRFESEPILEDGSGVVRLERLLEIIATGQKRLEAALGALSANDLAAETTEGERTTTPADRVHFAYFHDTYHTGQTELLRQIAGKDDHVI
jgi:hypothetical protein